MSGRDLSDVLVLIPCCKSKDGDGRAPAVQSAPWESDFPANAGALLEEGQKLVVKEYPKRFCLESPLQPAMVWYTGIMYETLGFRDALDAAFQRGLHCLIVSAGYGLLRPDDPIHKYNLKMSETLTIWRDRLPQVLADYIRSNGVRRVFATMSSDYCKAIVGVEALAHGADLLWYVPCLRSGKGHCPQRQVPEAVGHAVIDLIRSDFNPDECWKIAPTKNVAAPASPPTRVKGKDAASSRPVLTEAERAPGRAPRKPRASKGLDGPRRDIEEVWQRIQAHEGDDKEFSQKGGKRFRYSVTVSYLRPSTTNQNLPKRHFEEALSFLPLEGPGQINHLRGPSFIYGVLMDDRIRRRDW